MKNPPVYVLKINFIIFINIYSINIMITYTKSKEYMWCFRALKYN
ncbi:hypothetical protein CLL_A0185 [Clostridium botulinum B str. Eklund 17B (NRP)]|uniref:Uncharacterized protein n=1 Tax=Clostridium botulinum (strain Eklund 17B / Type B) TaxID=935198 RepID=B2TID1_CLOBB|nr:hypothetical protein CLL_A0185 [Clostridium botulinum B str. Eklund 17B (NRP)]